MLQSKLLPGEGQRLPPERRWSAVGGAPVPERPDPEQQDLDMELGLESELDREPEQLGQELEG